MIICFGSQRVAYSGDHTWQWTLPATSFIVVGANLPPEDLQLIWNTDDSSQIVTQKMGITNSVALIVAWKGL